MLLLRMPSSYQEFVSRFMLFTRQFRANKSVSTKLLSLENVTVLWDSVVEMSGEDKVESIKVRNVIR